MRVSTSYQIEEADRFVAEEHPWLIQRDSFVLLKCEKFEIIFDVDHSEALDSLIEAAKEARKGLEKIEYGA